MALKIRERFLFVWGLMLICPWLLIAQFSGGSGTEADPYLVANPHELDEVRNYPDACFRQIANIDLDVPPHNQDLGWQSIGSNSIPFTGTYNGAGFCISNLYINNPNYGGGGLFGTLQNAIMEDITIENGSIIVRGRCGLLAGTSLGSQIIRCRVNGELHGYLDAGGIVGSLQSNGRMVDCKAHVQIFAYTYIGGLVGWAVDSRIETSQASGYISGAKVMGGLVGDLTGSYISRSFASAELCGSLGIVGGLAGWAQGVCQIENSYARGSIETTITKGGICGYLNPSASIAQCYSAVVLYGINNGGIIGGTSGGSVTDSYYNSDLISQCINAFCEARSTAQMTYRYGHSTYVNWDFGLTWAHDESFLINDGYPYLAPEYVDSEEPLAPSLNLSLSSYPNPFSVFTNIKVSALSPVTKSGKVHSAGIAIYNIRGQQVKSISLDSGKSGEQLTYWDGRHTDNSRCASGIYFINLRVNGRNVSSRKVTIIR